jgi:PAT family beta-lactamase induction signal transducer AmpG
MFRVYFTSQQLLILALGFFSGLPLALTASTLTAWLADTGVERTAIGLFAAVATPYAFKFLWAPLMDALRLPLLGRLGRRRSWLLLCQVLLVASMIAMAGSNPASMPLATALIAVILATASASQDIVIDAYRVELLPTEAQGAGAAMATFGYRIGMLVSGAGALFLADHYGWHTTYFCMAGVMGVGALLTLLMRETSTAHTQRTVHSLRAFLRQSVIAPLADFTTRPHWVAVVCFIVLYKLGDAFLGTMFNPFLLDIGFTKSQIAEIVKLYGFAATMLGVFVGGALVAKLGMYRALMLSGVLHMGTNLLLVVQAQLGADAHFLIFSIASENLTGGMSTAAFIAYLSALCSLHYTATQYALVSSLAAFGRTWLSTPSGYVADAVGWEIFFAISCIISLPSLLVLWWIEHRKK